jgi:hypothetical protein
MQDHPQVSSGEVDESQVDLDIDTIGHLREIAWKRSPANVQALIDRLQAQIYTIKMPKRRRRLYRALIDYYEEVLEAREDSAGPARERLSPLEYARQIIKGIED